MTDEDKELVANMRETISEWMEDEPFDDWFLYQRDFAEAADRIEAQAAEIERLRSLIETTANHWLALQDKHPVQWEGAIDGAMAAACAEIVKLEKAMKVQASAVRTLQANEETEINILRQQKREWHQAVSSLDSEREANAILTAEIEKLREALELADAHVRRANMNMNVVERKIRAALGETE